jgi:hypothetical protein
MDIILISTNSAPKIPIQISRFVSLIPILSIGKNRNIFGEYGGRQESETGYVGVCARLSIDPRVRG